MLRALSTLLMVTLAACGGVAPVTAPRSPWTEVRTQQDTQLLWNGQLVLRTVHDFDAKDQVATFKIYTHVFGPRGEGPLTKGETTGLYPHHRGLFVGWNKVLFRGKRFDFWHGKDGVRFQLAARSSELTGDVARQTFTIDWNLADGTSVLQERRTLLADRDSTGVLRIAIESSFLAREPIELDGDPHHAGCHVRLAQEVADKEKETELLMPQTATRKKADDESVQSLCPWVALLCTVAGVRRVVVHFDSDAAGADSLCSIRRYGRIGAFAKLALPADRAVNRVWRVLVADADTHAKLWTREGIAAEALEWSRWGLPF